MSQVTFEVVMMNGMQLEVKVEKTDTVKQIKEDAEKQLGLQEQKHKFLKLVCDGDVLLPSMPVASLQSDMLFGSVSREQSLEVLRQAASSYPAYAELMASADLQTEGTQQIVATQAFPSILDVLEDLAGQPKPVKDMKAEDSGKLRFWGRSGGLLMPSLKAAPLKERLGADTLEEVSIIVGCNSDCYNRGLGVGLESSPLMCSTVDEKGIPSYMYNGLGVNDNSGDEEEDEEEEEEKVAAKPAEKKRNVVKFHPGMHGGLLRIEGVGGWNNTDIGFTPKSLSQTGGALHTLILTLRKCGRNTIEFKGAGADGPTWSKDWQRQLFDGDHIPSVFAFLDLGSTEDQGVMYGRVSLQACAAATTATRVPETTGPTGGYCAVA
eukprot:TRINITY_DN14630_c0_g1_i1.p1 TRINITY_DN14630_c0_g1~~TRINITY_DN14630_c0_g1_i1.p1  ORF type:complete len:407 (+),score=82.50 TRINITY_DN14630_c0_g1_i1:85-1221(+)